MKIALLMPLVVLMAGCGVELLTTTAIQGELQAEQLKAMKGQVSHAADASAKINIQRAIDTYLAEKGSYPQSLSDLVPGYLPSLPSKPDGTPYGYDATTGKVLDSATLAAAGPTSADQQKLQQIRNAINQYGMAVGYYPPTLSALVPTYLPAVPKTDSGEDFYYRCEDGTLMHPAQLRQPQQQFARPPMPANSGVGAGGAGPMGEVMTGIGMQNQLGSMSNAGSSSAGSYARGKLGGITEQHNQQQEQMLNSLGN